MIDAGQIHGGIGCIVQFHKAGFYAAIKFLLKIGRNLAYKTKYIIALCNKSSCQMPSDKSIGTQYPHYGHSHLSISDLVRVSPYSSE